MENEVTQQPGQAEPLTGAEQPQAVQTPPQVEGAGSRHEEPKGEGGNQFNALFRLLKKQNERFDALEQRLIQPPSQTPTSPAPQPEQGDIWADPESYVSQRARKETQAVLAEYDKRRAREEANNYVYSQDDVKTPEDVEDIKQVVKDNSLDVLAEINPQKAAQIAINLWRQQRGLSSPNGKADKTSAKLQAGGVQGSAVSSGKKVWTRGEIDRLAGTPEWAKHKDDVMAAYSEGRIKD